ncbi:hypothetical protein FKM82_008976 [Ascaphus truei]
MYLLSFLGCRRGLRFVALVEGLVIHSYCYDSFPTSCTYCFFLIGFCRDLMILFCSKHCRRGEMCAKDNTTLILLNSCSELFLSLTMSIS